jgi:hypothetical protein
MEETEALEAYAVYSSFRRRSKGLGIMEKSFPDKLMHTTPWLGRKKIKACMVMAYRVR